MEPDRMTDNPFPTDDPQGYLNDILKNAKTGTA
jgi:hypothetical protein